MTERRVSIKLPGDAKVDLLLGIDKMDVMATDRETRSGLPSAGSTGEMSRPNNLQRIAQKKAQVRNYARNKKLEKLAVYSSCKVGLFGVVVASGEDARLVSQNKAEAWIKTKLYVSGPILYLYLHYI